MKKYDYDFLTQKITKNLWKKIGTKRRAGVMCPLFSIYSKSSVGIGEFKDLQLMIDWCVETGNTILQLLPLNEVGACNSPYSSISCFALEPAYVSLSDIKGKKISIADAIKKLQKKYPTSTKTVDYGIRNEKIKILKTIFETAKLDYKEYDNFKKENDNWLEDYAVYKTLKEINLEKSWVDWDENFKIKDKETLSDFKLKYSDKIEFYKWLQWQLFEQLKNVSEYAKSKGVFLMGDIPFLASKDSADVWGQYRDYFNLGLVAGCPPDAYNALGQRWGMPGYNWQFLKEQKYDYFIKKLNYASNFYDLYRIDHVVGMFRLWTIDESFGGDNGLNGRFDPADTRLWKENGENILKAMIQSTTMLPCAEDLGVVPEECTKLLEEFGIPGIEVQRWLKHRDRDPRAFKKPDEFRKISCAISSSHDMSNTAQMWIAKFDTINEFNFKKSCEEKNIDFNTVAPKLFDLENSGYGKLRWKDDVVNVDILLWNLGKPYWEVSDIIDSYKETFNEKKLLFENMKNENLRFVSQNSQNLKEIVWDILTYTSSSASIYFVNSIFDIMVLEFPEEKIGNIWSFRVNTPGTHGDQNWSIRIPVAVENLKNIKINKQLLDMNIETNRV
jgi:4-alpha-glucanotransferase